MADPAPVPPVAPSPPPADLLARALRRAAAVRIAGYRQDERYAQYSVAALRERVVAMPGQPRARPGGWWCAGVLFDDLGGTEWRVWVHPERRVLRLRPREMPEARIPVPARHPDGRYFDGARRRWLLPGGAEVPAGDADASDSAPPA